MLRSQPSGFNRGDLQHLGPTLRVNLMVASSPWTIAMLLRLDRLGTLRRPYMPLGDLRTAAVDGSLNIGVSFLTYSWSYFAYS